MTYKACYGYARHVVHKDQNTTLGLNFFSFQDINTIPMVLINPFF